LSDQLSIRDHRQPGWFIIDNEIVDTHGKQLGAYGLAVYCVLGRYARNESQEVRLSARDIAASIGISQDRVRKSLGELAEAGLIHLAIPERPAPGLFSVVTLLNVKREPNVIRSVKKPTERHTFGSAAELNATRSPYKEEKTKTETETKKGYDRSLGDAIDWRKYCDARKQVQLKLDHGAWMNSEQILREQCIIAGISIDRALELEERMLQSTGASA
jgi:DNA-binding transcriptional ArsR family regulator